MKASIVVQDLSHAFQIGKMDLPVLHHLDFEIKQGGFVALCGQSGSGKSTLLNVIGGLMKPSSGKVFVLDEEISNYKENQLCLFRQKNMGFVFQSYNLMKYMTALENVEMPLLFSGISVSSRREMAEAMLEKMGLADRMHHRSNELSGGQQQRVSIARALVNDPSIVLADEPTGNLDSKTGDEIFELMNLINEEQKTTFVIVTHDRYLAKACKSSIYLKDGEMVSEEEAKL